MIDTLRNAKLLDEIPELAVARLLEDLHPQPVQLMDGETLCRSGDPANCMWVITSGRIVVSQIAGGNVKTVTDRGPNAVIGEVGLIVAGQCRSATMTASGRATLLKIQRECVESISDCETRAQFWRNLATIVAEKLAHSVPARAMQAAEADTTEGLLRLFANPYAIAETRNGLKSTYRQERAVIWFSDVVGFSSIAEKVLPDMVAKLIQTAMTRQSTAILETGGEIDKFVGDGLMAYWIVSGTREQDIRATVNKAFRAAETALKSIAELLSPLDQTPLGLRIGLNYGEPYSGNFGSESRHAFTLIGHDVNLAARLEQASAGVNEEPLGSIRVGENFYQYLDAANRLRLSAPIAFKVKKTEATLFTNLPATAD